MTQDFGVVAIGQFLVRLRGLLVIPILLRGLGTYEYGLWTLLVTSITLGSSLAGLGVPQALERYAASHVRTQDAGDEFLASLLVGGLSAVLAASALTAGARLLGGIVHQQLSTPLFVLAAWVLVAHTVHQVALMFFRARFQMRLYSLFELLTVYGELALMVVLIEAGRGLFGVLLAAFLVRLVLIFVMLAVVARRIAVRWPKFDALPAYLRYGIPTVLMGLTYWIVESSDRYFVGVLGGPTAVGVYAAAYGVASMLMLVRMPFMVFLPPAIFHFWDNNDRARVHRYLARAMRYYLLVASPLWIGLSLLARPVLSVIARPDIADRAGLVVPIVATAIFLYGLSGISGLVFWLRQQSGRLSAVWVAAALLNLVLNATLIPLMGITGAALATLGAYAVPAGICLAAYARLVGLRFSVLPAGRLISALLLMALVLQTLRPASVIALIAAVILAGIVYLFGLVLTRLVGIADVQAVRSALLRG